METLRSHLLDTRTDIDWWLAIQIVPNDQRVTRQTYVSFEVIVCQLHPFDRCFYNQNENHSSGHTQNILSS